MLSDNLKNARKQKGLTQNQLAEMIGVQRAVISKYESGMIEPSPSQLQRIADILGVSVSTFLDENEITVDFAMRIAQALALIQLIYEIEETPEAIKKLIERQNIDIDALILQLSTVTLKAYHPAEIDVIRNRLNAEGWKRVLEFAEEMTQIPKYQRNQNPPTEKNKPRPEPEQGKEKP